MQPFTEQPFCAEALYSLTDLTFQGTRFLYLWFNKEMQKGSTTWKISRVVSGWDLELEIGFCLTPVFVFALLCNLPQTHTYVLQ